MSTRFYPRQTDYIVLLNAMDDDVQAAIQKGDLAVQWAIQPTGEVVPGKGYSAFYYAKQAGDYAAQVNNGIAQAQAWATQAAGEVVVGKGYSAFYYSQQAGSSAALALNWATSMATFAGSGGMYGAKYYATDAATSAASARDYRDTATSAADYAQKWATQSAGEVVAGKGYSALKYATDAGNSAKQSGDSATLAQNWAVSMVNTFTGAGGLYGAKYYATDAKDSATIALKWATLLGTEVVQGQGYSAAQYAANAGGSATLAQKWAVQLGETVDGTEYSAKKHAIDAKAYMEAAQAAANGATQGQINSDWNESSPTAKAFIRNKPHIPENGSDIGLDKVENKSATDILSELTQEQALESLGDSVVKTEGDQIIEGIKSFTQAIKVPTISQDAAPGTDAASTQYVKDSVAQSGADVSRQLKRAMALAILGL